MTMNYKLLAEDINSGNINPNLRLAFTGDGGYWRLDDPNMMWAERLNLEHEAMTKYGLPENKSEAIDALVEAGIDVSWRLK